MQKVLFPLVALFALAWLAAAQASIPTETQALDQAFRTALQEVMVGIEQGDMGRLTVEQRRTVAACAGEMLLVLPTEEKQRFVAAAADQRLAVMNAILGAYPDLERQTESCMATVR